MEAEPEDTRAPVRQTPRGVWRKLRGKPFGRLANLVAGLMMLIISAVSFLYAAGVPGLDPITIWPNWFWTVLFAALALLFAPLLRWRRTVLVLGFALLTGLLLNEEPWFVLRDAWHDPAAAVSATEDRGNLLQVVTVNCGAGDSRALEDALTLRPDIILLQESPGTSAIESVAPDGWQHAGWGDCAVMVRGSLHATEHSKYLAHEMYVVRATPERLGRPLTVISTHLVLPSLRTDIWRPEVWRKARMLQQSRREAIQHILDQRDRYGKDLPVIVGGDFNTGAGNWLLEPLLANGLTDVFGAAGHGWPNTITSDYPMERIDFIWADEHFEPLDARVVVTPHSDHRMVQAAVAVR